jgi:hypothetical protein
MNTDLPPVIAAFFHAHNTGQTDDFNQLFTGDALVSDEARVPGCRQQGVD